MPENRRNPLLVAVVGPTGAGKSDLALSLAARFGGEILGCDSVQVYRGFDIGSAKVPPHARRGIPHHLIDVIGPGEELTAGEYMRLGRNVLSEVSARGRLPLVVGGTGFYLRALLEGLSPAPARSETLRERLARVERRRPAALSRFLRRFDPLAAVRIHPRDTQKLIRAVEVTLLAGRPASETQSSPRDPLSGFNVLRIGLLPDRARLRLAINARTEKMFAGGLLEEVKALLKEGVPPTAKPMQAVGYKQALAVVEGRATLAEAVGECQARTRQYAKRQLTWFRNSPDIRWLAGFGSEPAVESAAAALVEQTLVELA